MNGPSRFEVTDEQRQRNARGLAACRAVIEPVLARRDRPEPEKPLTPAEEIHQRALERAVAEKRARRMTGLASIGAVLEAPPAPARDAPNRAAAERDRLALHRLARAHQTKEQKP